jgi:hypothetical protein
MKKIIIITALSISFTVFAQRNNKDANYIGVFVGLDQMSLNTNNFDAKPEISFHGGISIRGNFYNDFDMVYGMQFSESKFSLESKDINATTQKVVYKLPAVQIFITPSYKIIENHLSVELGPVIQINDKFKFDKELENNTLLSNSTLTVNDISDVSKLNLHLLAGVTGGLKHLRLNVQYQLGLTNILSKLNNKDIVNGPSFSGTQGILSCNLIGYF